MMKKIQKILKSPAPYIVIILMISYFTYFHKYSNPPDLFWDENYHIASAEKYIQGVFFMEPHPPLGKLMIAAGEKLLDPNKHIDKSEFLTTDYIKDIPDGYSFAGVRFIPTLFAMLAAPLFFLVLYNLTGYLFLSFLFSGLYLFENAYIVHSRGAMLEGIQIFFIMLLLNKAAGMLKRGEKMMKEERNGKEHINLVDWGVMGVLFGLILSTKLNGMVFGLLPIFILALQTPKFSKIIQSLAVFGLSTLFVFISVYSIHFMLARTVLDDRYYEATHQYKTMIAKKQNTIPATFPHQFVEHIRFIFHYEKGVPVYDFCKEDENGSLPITWPVGNKSINYRWERVGDSVKYLYLQGNPVIWFFGLMSAILTFVHITSVLIFQASIKNKHIYKLLAVFFSLYVGYMAIVISIPRVMYLYHYFIPLILSLIMGVLLFVYVFENQMKRKFTNAHLIAILLVLLVLLAYFFFRPLTYYLPLNPAQFELRNWLPLWGLKSVAN